MEKASRENTFTFFQLLITFFLAMTWTRSAAQVTGHVAVAKGEAAAAATVRIVNKENKAVTHTVCNSKGYFSIDTKNIKEDTLTLLVTYAGYEPFAIKMGNMPAKADLGTIMMKSVTLQEVVVTPESRIVHPDRNIIFPDKSMVKASNNGYALLSHLFLPGISVDPHNKSVGAIGGGKVDIYINDRRATKADIVALRPDEVIYIEHIDAPGVRYGSDGIDAAINFVVRRRYAGVIAGIDTKNAVTTGSGNNFVFSKINNKLSEFSIYYSNDYADIGKRRMSQSDVLCMTDGSTVNIEREGINTPLSYIEHDLQLAYNLSKPRKYVFRVDVMSTFYNSQKRQQEQKVTETGKSPYFIYTHPTEEYFSPRMDIYWKLYLPKKQILTFSMLGTYRDTDYGYSYLSSADKLHADTISSYGYTTLGDKYSLISEARYSKTFGKHALLIGGKNSTGHTRNRYAGEASAETVMDNSNTYLYAQMSGTLKKLKYVAGIGTSYDHYKQDDCATDFWTFRPTLSLTYSPLNFVSLRYVFRIKPVTPSLSMLSDVRQQTDDYRIVSGNPLLEPYHKQEHGVSLNYQSKRLIVVEECSFNYSDKPIMDEITRAATPSGSTIWETGFANQKSLTSLKNKLGAAYYIIPDKLVLQGAFIFTHYDSKGHSYRHQLDDFAGQMQADFMLKSWNIRMQWTSRTSSLMGETVATEASNTLISVQKTWRQLTVGLSFTDFLRNDRIKDMESVRHETMKKSYVINVPSMRNMVSVSLSWNFSKGRKYNALKKNINNNDDDSGILKI